MADIEIIEIGVGHHTILAYEPPDPLAGAEIVAVSDVQLPPGSGVPIGPAGGVLSGNYPNPGFAVNMATQAELVSTVDARLAMHRDDATPHPAYDELPDLTLWFRNALL